MGKCHRKLSHVAHTTKGSTNERRKALKKHNHCRKHKMLSKRQRAAGKYVALYKNKDGGVNFVKKRPPGSMLHKTKATRKKWPKRTSPTFVKRA